jgi:hypothetical protein
LIKSPKSRRSISNKKRRFWKKSRYGKKKRRKKFFTFALDRRNSFFMNFFAAVLMAIIAGGIIKLSWVLYKSDNSVFLKISGWFFCGYVLVREILAIRFFIRQYRRNW